MAAGASAPSAVAGQRLALGVPGDFAVAFLHLASSPLHGSGARLLKPVPF